MINKQLLIQTFTDLVKIDSPSGEEKLVATYISKFLSDLNISNRLDKYGNVIGKIPSQGESCLLTAHMDTVEPGRSISPSIKNGKLISLSNTILGADNKATVAAILTAIKHAISTKLPTRPLELVFTCSEEVKNLGAVNLDYSKLTSKYGYSFDLGAPIGTIYTASPYYNSVDITIVGQASHASKPDDGINALSVAIKALNKIKLGFIDKDTICNFGQINGGTTRNTIPEKINLHAEVRSYSKKILDKVTEDILVKFETEAKKYGAQMQSTVYLENPGFVLSNSDQQVENLKRIYQKLKITPQLKKTYGCFDANVFISHGIKIINSSDGSKHNHTEKEEVGVKDLIKLTQVIIELIKV